MGIYYNAPQAIAYLQQNDPARRVLAFCHNHPQVRDSRTIADTLRLPVEAVQRELAALSGHGLIQGDATWTTSSAT